VSNRDANDLHARFISPAVRRFLWDNRVIAPDRTLDIIAESARLFAQQGCGLWIVTRHEAPNEAMGFTGLWHFRDPPQLELLFGIAERWWGQGLATESARAVVRYAFDRLGLERVDASTDVPNTASIRVLEQLGMRWARRETIGGLDTVFFAIEASKFARAGRR
jgi:ribosomal-protein-alanine N-acetyltransferase